MKTKKITPTERKEMEKKYEVLWRKKLEGRNDSDLWKVMTQGNLTDDELYERDLDYERCYSLVNLAYMLADVQDSCLTDLESITRKYGRTTTMGTKQTYKRVMNAIASLKRVLGVPEDTVKTHDSAGYIHGNSDVIYDVARMMIDRLAEKKDVVHLIHLIRTMPNINSLFPHLDKGHYLTDFNSDQFTR